MEETLAYYREEAAKLVSALESRTIGWTQDAACYLDISRGLIAMYLFGDDEPDHLTHAHIIAAFGEVLMAAVLTQANRDRQFGIGAGWFPRNRATVIMPTSNQPMNLGIWYQPLVRYPRVVLRPKQDGAVRRMGYWRIGGATYVELSATELLAKGHEQARPGNRRFPNHPQLKTAPANYFYN